MSLVPQKISIKRIEFRVNCCALFKTVFGNLIVISKHIRLEKADNSLFIKNNVLGVSVAKVEVTGAFSG